MDPATVAQMMEVARAMDAAQAEGHGMSWQALVTIGVPIWLAVAGAVAWVWKHGKALVKSEQACRQVQASTVQCLYWMRREIGKLGGDVDSMPPIPTLDLGGDAAE